MNICSDQCRMQNFFKFPFVFFKSYRHWWGTRWRGWLKHCATSRKVAVSIPVGVIGVFHWHNPSGRTMALGSTQPLNRNEYQKLFLGSKGGRWVGLTTLPPSCAECLAIWEPLPTVTLRACPDLKWDCFTFYWHWYLFIYCRYNRDKKNCFWNIYLACIS